MNEESCWRGLFGWPGSVESFVTPEKQPPQRPPALPPAPKPAPKASAPAGAKAKAKAAATSSGSSYSSVVVEELNFVDGYAELKSLLGEVDRATHRAAYYADQTRKRHHWSVEELRQNPVSRCLVSSTGSKRRKTGGSPPWEARRHVLGQMCTDWFGR